MQLQERIGAFIVPGGCFFRVWAPNAENVAVLVQDPPYWEVDDVITRQDLVKGAKGYWSGIVPGVCAYQLYRFEIKFGGSRLERLDPAGRDVFSSELVRREDPSNRNASVISGPDPFSWAPFQTPAFENFIIYQFHIGTFSGRNDFLGKDWASFEDTINKLGYVCEMGFNCIQPLPVHEYSMNRSWGYNPATFFAPESSFGSPFNLCRLVDAAHRQGLAVIFDVVYNHAGDDNSLWEYDGETKGGGIYFEGGQQTSWGIGPAWWKEEVQDFFYQNARMFLEEYNADGLRFDVTTQINGNHLKLTMDRLRRDFPNKYLIAEHLPDHPWIVKTGRFCATWDADAHHETQRALAGQDPLQKIKGILGWEGYDHAWNLVRYTLGSQDDVGDQNGGNAEDGLKNWDKRHRYFVDQLGGRNDWTARAKCRLAWALNIAMPGTPMMFMGSECSMASPHVSWGYWHDGSDWNGDHRFNWSIAGDPAGMEMRRLTAACNAVRWSNPALRADSLSIPHEDPDNQVLGFVRESYDNVVLTVVNLSGRDFGGHGYGVDVGGRGGQWTQILCTQDAAFGGWDGAGNAFYEPWTQGDGKVYINLPKWSAVMLRRK